MKPRRTGPNPRRLVLRALARLGRSPGAVGQQVLRQVLDGPDARTLEPRDRALVTECFYGVLRWRLRLDAAIGRVAKKGLPSDPELLNLLRLGAFQLLILDRVPARAAVHTSVSIARKLRGESVSRFVNGVLRAIDRDRTPPSSLAERWSHPAWMVERLRQQLDPEALEARLRANMAPPPLTLRVHPQTTQLPEGARESAVKGVVIVDGYDAVVRTGIRDGRWLPQDPASARVVRLLAPEPGDHVLELCAGRGVKTTQLCEAVGPEGRVVSIDRSAGRLAAARRLVTGWSPDVSVRTLCADAARPLPIRPDLRFDRVLVDAPCSGLGVIRRRPETLWRRRPEDIEVLAALQRAILTEAERWVRPGGTLVYAVCTTTDEETVQIIGDRAVADGFETRPERDEQDGFYAARLAL